MPRVGRLVLSLVGLLTYAFLPTKNYYWDGISFALTIENAHRWVDLFHPNHLTYNLVGWVVYRLLGESFRALYLMQALNALFAALAVYVIAGVAETITRSVKGGLLLGAAFAISGTFWRFATDADAYILSVLLLALCARELLLRAEPRSLVVAIWHTLAMLIHQLSFLFLPAALYLLWKKRGWRAAILYFGVTSIATLGAYVGAFRLQNGVWDAHAFMRWMASHANDVTFSFQLLRNLRISFVSWLQLIVVGRPAIVHYKSLTTIVLLVLMGATLAMLIAAILNRRPAAATDGQQDSDACDFALIWLASYALFLFFWLPNNTFYKLFALPALVILAGTYGRGSVRSCWFWATVLLGLFNLTFGIIPYASENANAAVAFALGLHRPLKNAQTIVYYQSIGPDDNLVKYFTPSAEWKAFGSTQALDADLHAGKAVWLDTSSVDTLSVSEPAWFSGHVAKGERYELVDAKHHIRFVRLG